MSKLRLFDVADPKGFLNIPRLKVPKRPVDERIHDYKQVYLPIPTRQARDQAARCMDCGVPFCNTACPVHNLIPEWNDLVYRDQWREAIDRLHATNNFPEFTGTLCPAPCESGCVLSINDSPVNIKEVERSIIERAFSEQWVTPIPPEIRSGKKVAVVGSGPAGLAAAQQLNRAGHLVTVFEKDDTIGGLLVYGIPDFKMEKWQVERRVVQMKAEGVEFRTGVHVGVTPTVTTLKEDYDAVLLTVGALRGRDVDVPGRDLKGIHMAMDYLVQQNRRVAGRPTDDAFAISAKDKRVVILGGGDTGADCLGNVNREQCRSVEILTRGPQPPDAAHPMEWPDVPFVLRTWPAHEEGGERHYDVLIQGFSGKDGHVERVHMMDAERTPSGRLEPVPGSERTMEADLVLLSVGFTGPVQDQLFTEISPQMTPQGAIAINEQYETSVPNVFAAGDASRGASLIVWAIADGRNAAAAIDASL